MYPLLEYLLVKSIIGSFCLHLTGNFIVKSFLKWEFSSLPNAWYFILDSFLINVLINNFVASDKGSFSIKTPTFWAV